MHQLIIALSGSFDVILDDGKQRQRFHLNRSYNGIYVCPMIWRELDNFSSASVCMVLASNLYDEADYFRDYQEFVKARTYDPSFRLAKPGRGGHRAKPETQSKRLAAFANIKLRT